MNTALYDAGLRASDMQYVNAHGSGSKVGDTVEAETIGMVFQSNRKYYINSTKPLVGHCLSAASIVGTCETRLFDNDTPLNSVESLADHYVALINTYQSSGNLVLGGLSGGGVIAYACAQKLTFLGRCVEALLLIDCAVPAGKVTDTSAENSFLNQVIQAGNGNANEANSVKDGYIDQLAQVSEWIRNDGGANPFQLFRKSLTEVEKYQAYPYDGKTVLVSALQQDLGDEQASRHGMGAALCGSYGGFFQG
ncbi:thioesterase domain-containing protein [Microbulbifer sp. 2205BS26-8]|uniref:thioesterase domain-containing protein n=1 Tax=Microbulbifer sp. 2205BS26-8 TaxID=3064386 RepID=UPI00273F3F8D|nr:thioesterase domain-containing protein [Microbulbifer sp. 2205BS26-8]MDP5210200.1 thioesterase domain-containing protein [Microbulbifer sp. 2205BS26-8]